MRSKYIPAFLVTLALAAPLVAGPRAGARAASPAPHAQAAPRREAAPVQRNAQPGPYQSRVPPPSHQIIRGQGPHNGDWLRHTMQLPPQERQQRLEQDQHFQQLPKPRQEQLRNRLQTFNSYSPQQQQRVLNRMEMIEHLPPEQQQQAQKVFGQFRNMDPQRKAMVRGTLRQMRAMPPEARERLLTSPEIQSRYSPQEIQMLRDFNSIGFAGPEQP